MKSLYLHVTKQDIHHQPKLKTINNIASECIPNRYVRIRPSDPPRITSEIKRNIRKRKRAFRRAKRTDADSHWENLGNYETRLSILSVIQKGLTSIQ